MLRNWKKQAFWPPCNHMKKKKTYEKPKIKTEKVFETAALACGKCLSGPINQLACKTLKKFS